MTKRRNLKGYEPHGKPISLGDDLTRKQQKIRKKCRAKFEAMKKKPQKFQAVKMYSYCKIVANDTVKPYDQWEL